MKFEKITRALKREASCKSFLMLYTLTPTSSASPKPGLHQRKSYSRINKPIHNTVEITLLQEAHNKLNKNYLLLAQLQDLMHLKASCAPFNGISFSYEAW